MTNNLNYIQCPSGRRIYGNKTLLNYGLDWVNIFGIILVIIGGIMIVKEML